MRRDGPRAALAACAMFGVLAACALGAHAEPIKIGTLKVAASGPLYVAVDKGYFAAEGLDAKIVFFEAAVPNAVGVVTGELDFSTSALVASIYNLAGHGELRIIAGASREVPGFQGQSFLASNRAYAAGLTTLKDFAGHSFAVSQRGGPANYVLGLIAAKYGFPLSSVRILAMQTLPNALSAVVGGKADTTIISMSPSFPSLIASGKVKFLGWVGDEVSWQYGAAFTSARIADGKPDEVKRFLRAYRKATREYYDAFTGPDGKRRDGPEATAILAILAKYTGQTVAQLREGVPYYDRDDRLDVADVERQIAWYEQQGMLKGSIDPQKVIDKRYVVPLPRP